MKTEHWQLLAAPPFSILANLDRVDEAIDANAEIASEILAHALPAFGLDLEPKSPERDWRQFTNPRDLSKARVTITQLYRDWSAEGFAERNACNGPVMDDIEEIFDRTPDKASVRILVPGAGLGRLVFDLARKGFSVQGNEISYHQLMASNWVLNHSLRARQFKLFPFALKFSNIVNREHQLQAVEIPDVHPGTELDILDEATMTPAGGRMTMNAGDFVVLYGDEAHREMFDAVATVFFIDTAPNIIRYIEVVHNCLKEGGVWTNAGPLLWHHEDPTPREVLDAIEQSTMGDKVGIAEPGSVELTVEEVLSLVEKMGFVIEKSEIRDVEAGYIQNPESLYLNMYRLSHWLARKCSF